MILLIGFAFAAGRSAAHRIKLGQVETLVDVQRSRVPVVLDTTAPVVYLGHIGDYFAVYELRTQSHALTWSSSPIRLGP